MRSFQFMFYNSSLVFRDYNYKSKFSKESKISCKSQLLSFQSVKGFIMGV